MHYLDYTALPVRRTANLGYNLLIWQCLIRIAEPMMEQLAERMECFSATHSRPAKSRDSGEIMIQRAW